jgi:hypothetical protein
MLLCPSTDACRVPLGIQATRRADVNALLRGGDPWRVAAGLHRLIRSSVFTGWVAGAPRLGFFTPTAAGHRLPIDSLIARDGETFSRPQLTLQRHAQHSSPAPSHA